MHGPRRHRPKTVSERSLPAGVEGQGHPPLTRLQNPRCQYFQKDFAPEPDQNPSSDTHVAPGSIAVLSPTSEPIPEIAHVEGATDPITDDIRTRRGKVHGLRASPFIGNLFGSRKEDLTRRTLIVFMRSRITDDEQNAQAAAARQFQPLRDAEAAQPPRSLFNE